MPVLRSLSVVVLITLLAGGCGQAPRLQKLQGHAEGTTYHISWWSGRKVNAAELENHIQQALAKVDREISTYRKDSDLEKFNRSRSTDWQTMPADVIALLETARIVHTQSRGCYDPTIKPLFDLWGFQKDKLHVPSADEIAQVRSEIGFERVKIDKLRDRIRKTIPDLQLDLSSMGEGYTIWNLARVFDRAGIDNYLIEFGGDMMVKGHKPDGKRWRVAIERPMPGQVSVQKVVSIDNEDGVSVNTSGTYRHYFDKDGHVYSHILNPRTGAPVTHNLVSATVFGRDPRLTDAWATAMLCMGKKEGEKVAERLDLKVFFIQQEKNYLLESESPELRNTSDVTVQD